ncbi:MAG: acyl-CoA dehydrogenase family protein [Acidimicrobiales bacterium]
MSAAGFDALAAVAAVAPTVAAAIDESERAARMPAPVAAELARAGLFRLATPAALGGHEASCAEIMAAIEALAEVHGSAGWCLMIGATTATIAGYLAPEVGREVFGDPLTITGGAVAPTGRAARTEGGHRLSGQWSYGSGTQNCTWITAGALVGDPGGESAAGAASITRPDARLFLLAAEQVEITENWQVLGLRGTGSHDFTVSDAFVPEGRSVALAGGAPTCDGALYRFPLLGLLALGIGAVSLGVGRAALDAFARLAEAKVATSHSRPLRERAAVQLEVARAEATLRAARAFFYDEIDRAWRRALDGERPSVDTRALLRLAATHAATAAADAATTAYTLAGGASLREGELQRCFRDAHAATQHLMVAPPTYEVAGRVLLGLSPGGPI